MCSLKCLHLFRFFCIIEYGFIWITLLNGRFYLCSSSGLWPDGSDGTDINAVCSSNEKRLLTTGDDFGKVHLFSFPCSQSRVSNQHVFYYLFVHYIPVEKNIYLTVLFCFDILSAPLSSGSQSCLWWSQQSCHQC